MKKVAKLVKTASIFDIEPVVGQVKILETALPTAELEGTGQWSYFV